MSRYEDQPADVLLRDLFDLGIKGMRTVDDEMEYDDERPKNCVIQWNNCPDKPGTYAIVAIEVTPC